MKRLLVLAILLPVFLFAEFVNFSGSVNIYAEYDAINGDTLQESTSELRFNLNPTLTIYGMPLEFDLFLTSIESDLRQALNKYRIFLQPEKLLREMVHLPGFVFSISGVEIGTCYPYYSPFSLTGIPVTGGAVEVNPGPIYLAATAGRVQRGVVGSDTTDAAYERMLYAGRLGIGGKDDSHILFTFLYSGDDTTSIPPYTFPVASDSDTVEVITPQENYVVGIDLKLSLFNDNFSVESEIAASQLTDDIRMPEVVIQDIPQWLSGIINPRISSSYDYAYSVKSNLYLFNTGIYGLVNMIGPGFSSFGTSNLRNDNLTYEFGLDKSLLDNNIIFSASNRREHDNLIGSKTSTTFFSSYNFNVGLNFSNLPYLQVAYTPYRESNDSLDIDRRTDILSLGTGYNFTMFNLDNSMSFYYSRQSYRETSDSNNYASNSFSINNSINFNFPLNISAGFGITNTDYADREERIISFDMGASYTSFERWTNTIGFNISSEGEKGSRNGIYFNSSLSMGWFGYMNFNAERNFYSGEYEEEDYDEWRIIGSVSKSW